MKIFSIKKAKQGKGVFAARKISKGELVFLVPALRYNKISYAALLRKRATDNPIQISPRRYLDWRAPGVIFNHSCKPNVGLTAYPKMTFIALRDIKRGEEMRWDYSTSIDKDTECDFVCVCGARNCRKAIGGFKHINRALKRFYLARGVVQNYLFSQ